MSMIKAAAILDPRQLGILQNSEDRNISNFAAAFPDICDFNNPSTQFQLLNEWEIYINTKHIIDQDKFDVLEFWKSWPGKRLASIALRILYIPVSAVDVERSFSKYRDIFSELRRRLLPESTANLCCLYINQKLLL